MKRTTLFLILSFACGIVNAQTQQGIVKTPTRRNVDGTWRQGQYLSNATISIRLAKNDAEQHYVSGNQGIFSFPAPSPYFVTSVVANKGTYTFIDADFSKKEQRYSTNAVEILVDDPDLLSKVREEAEAHERKKIKEQIRAKEDEIEELKAANKLTTAEYNQMLEQLSEYRKSSEAIVKQIAEVYVMTDFDKMDEFNRQLLAFVEDGDFAKADSLLKTKGSKEDEFKRIKNEEAAIQKTKEELQQAEEYHEKDKKSFSDRLYSEHLMHLQRPLMQDSALYCLKLRADLDTTNISAVFDYAELCNKQGKFTESENYYMICLREHSRNDNTLGVADIQCCLGCLYNETKDYGKSEFDFVMALEIYELLSEEAPDSYCDRLALAHACLALKYFKTQDYSNGEKHRKLAMEYSEMLFSSNPDVYRLHLMLSQAETGAFFVESENYKESEKYYKLALENCEILSQENPDVYRPQLALIQASIGTLYGLMGDYTNCEEYNKAALNCYEILFQQNPDAYRSTLAALQNSLGSLYDSLNDYVNSEKYHKFALAHYEVLVKQNPKVYLGDLARTRNALGFLCLINNDFSGGEKYFRLALNDFEQLYAQNPVFYRADLAQTQSNLGMLYLGLNDLTNSEKYYKLALVHYEQLFKKNPDDFREPLAFTQKYLGIIYGNLYDYPNSIQYYKQALVHYEQMFSANPDAYRADLAMLQSGLGWLYGFAFQDRYNGVKYFLSATKNYEQLFKQTPSLYISEYGNTLNSLAYMYAGLNEFQKSLKTIDEAISLLPDNANFYDTKGEILLMQGKNEEALEMWKKVLELNPDFLKENPDGTNLSNGLKNLGLIE